MDLYELIEDINDGKYSELQLERHFETMLQIRNIWFKVYELLKFCRNYGMENDEMNRIITIGLYKFFFSESRDCIEDEIIQYNHGINKRLRKFNKQKKLLQMRKSIKDL
jgi:hypothetical protein